MVVRKPMIIDRVYLHNKSGGVPVKKLEPSTAFKALIMSSPIVF